MILSCVLIGIFVVFKQKTAYEMRISDWSSDVCSSDLTDDRGNESRLARFVGRDSGIMKIGPVGTLSDLWMMGPCLRRGTSGVFYNEIGRASCRERVCQYVLILVVDLSLKIKRVYNATAHSNKGTVYRSVYETD